MNGHDDEWTIGHLSTHRQLCQQPDKRVRRPLRSETSLFCSAIDIIDLTVRANPANTSWHRSYAWAMERMCESCEMVEVNPTCTAKQLLVWVEDRS
jgi:hypothetical protein